MKGQLRKSTRISVLGALAAGALLIAACGSSSNQSASRTGSTNTASGGSTSSSSTAVEAAKALVTQYSTPQPPINPAPLHTKPPAGKMVYVLTCGFPSCQATTAGVIAGAKALGWTTKTYTSQITPEGYTATWNQMLRNPPNAIVYTGLLPDATIQSQLAKVKIGRA